MKNRKNCCLIDIGEGSDGSFFTLEMYNIYKENEKIQENVKKYYK